VEPHLLRKRGRVSDAQYTCSTGDGGGVHSNSGVPNHAYALLVDGGTYNGQTIAALGLTKAAHIYYRAQSVYQGPASDFADHADALDQSCSDLIGVDLADLSTGAPSGQLITAADCAQVAKAAAAVELRNPPTQCNFQPLLAQDPPQLCDAGGFATQLFHDGFDNGNSSAAAGPSATALPPTSRRVTGRSCPVCRRTAGQRLLRFDFRVARAPGETSPAAHLVSPQIAIPASVTDPRLTFDHWVATEAGGRRQPEDQRERRAAARPAADFVYNPYNHAERRWQHQPLAPARLLGADGGLRRLVGTLHRQPRPVRGAEGQDPASVRPRDRRLLRHLRVVHRRPDGLQVPLSVG
jgi:hypothetical protein